jgi:hypothetical protein
MIIKSKPARAAVQGALALLCLGLYGGVALAAEEAGKNEDGFSYNLSGFARGWASANLQNQPELQVLGKRSRGELSMVRGSLELDADVTTGPIKWKAIGRADREYKTSYLQQLQDLRATNGTAVGGASHNILDNYNQAELREFWVEMPLGERITVKLGKQQLVWGESDFFHAMDLVNGYDLSWRLFFEGENEEWRKPLIMATAKIRVPEADGMLALFARPGLDRCQDIGNTYDVQGGRWFFQPYRGFDLSAITDKDCKHPDGRQKDLTGGARWSGEALGLNYSVAALRTFAADPVANSAARPYMVAPSGSVFDLIHPHINVFGTTFSGYNGAIDSVLSAEFAYTKGQPYNVGTGSLAAPTVPGNVGLGLGGVMKKNTLTTMLRVDRNLHLENWLGTSRPSFSSIQLFDTYVVGFKPSDDLVRLFAYGTPLTRHNTILTVFTTLNYRNDSINPGFAAGFDLTHGGGFAIPSVSATLSDKWTAKLEADLFWARHSNTAQFSNQSSQLFGYFDKANQLVLRVTRQF